MTRDSGVMRQHPDYPQAIQELLDQFHQRQQTPKLATNPDELERAFEWIELVASFVDRSNLLK